MLLLVCEAEDLAERGTLRCSVVLFVIYSKQHIFWVNHLNWNNLLISVHLGSYVCVIVRECVCECVFMYIAHVVGT